MNGIEAFSYKSDIFSYIEVQSIYIESTVFQNVKFQILSLLYHSWMKGWSEWEAGIPFMEVCYHLKDITIFSRGKLNDALLKMAPDKSFSVKMSMKHAFLVLESTMLVYPDGLFCSLSVTDIK